ncbi:hypothetical protein [Streptomyces sp. BE230]|uniref:hypothetical protein n=1 Tax=Streptomyces sp. BE230 TaxID=3002526 RepID=UPI002ED03E41|nr:hypothetical protein [Streptomyces sp. BE230]
MAIEANLQQQAKEAIYEKIIEAANNIESSHTSASVAPVLKTLAEAYAWVTYPNQSH